MLYVTAKELDERHKRIALERSRRRDKWDIAALKAQATKLKRVIEGKVSGSVAQTHSCRLDELNLTQRAMARWIDAHPGQTYDEIAVGIKKSPKTLRATTNSRALKKAGYTLPRGRGWFPPRSTES